MSSIVGQSGRANNTICAPTVDNSLPPGYVRVNGYIQHEKIEEDGTITYTSLAMRTIEHPMLVDGKKGLELHFFSARRGERDEIVLPCRMIGKASMRGELYGQGFLFSTERGTLSRLSRFFSALVEHIQATDDVWDLDWIDDLLSP